MLCRVTSTPRAPRLSRTVSRLALAFDPEITSAHIEAAVSAAERNRVVRALQQDPRYCLSRTDYMELVRTTLGPARFSPEEAEVLLEALGGSGVVLRVGAEGMEDRIFLHPQKVLDMFLSADAIKGVHLERVADKTAELAALKAEESRLATQQHLIDEAARSKAARFFWGCFGLMAVKMGVVARLTWWEFSWDVMEPVTYFIGFSVSILAYLWFLLRNEDYNYRTLRQWWQDRARRRMYAKVRYDPARLLSVREAVQRLEEELQRELPGGVAKAVARSVH